MKTTNYKRLWKRAVDECVQLSKSNTTLLERLSETTKVLLVLKDLVDEFIPKSKHEKFKKELDKRFKAAKIPIPKKDKTN